MAKLMFMGEQLNSEDKPPYVGITPNLSGADIGDQIDFSGIQLNVEKDKIVPNDKIILFDYTSEVTATIIAIVYAVDNGDGTVSNLNIDKLNYIQEGLEITYDSSDIMLGPAFLSNGVGYQKSMLIGGKRISTIIDIGTHSSLSYNAGTIATFIIPGGSADYFPGSSSDKIIPVEIAISDVTTFAVLDLVKGYVRANRPSSSSGVFYALFALEPKSYDGPTEMWVHF